MLNAAERRKPIAGTNGKPFGGRPLKGIKARAREARDGRFGGPGGYWNRQFLSSTRLSHAG